MNMRAIWWTCFLRTTLRHPALLIGSIGGITAGVAISCALLLANGRVLRALDLSAGTLEELQVDAVFETREWRSSHGRVPESSLAVCMQHLPAGVNCRGVMSRLLRAAGTEIQIIGIDGSPSTIRSPMFSMPLAERFPSGITTANGIRIDPFASVPGSDYFMVLPYAQARDLGEGAAAGYDFIEAYWRKDDASAAKAVEELTAAYHGRLARTSRDERVSESRMLTATYRLNLLVLGGMSILVGCLLVANVASLYLLVKRPVISVLRQLGCSTRALAFFLLSEQVVLGLVGAILGIFVGLILESVVSERVLLTIERIYLREAATRAALSPGLALGMLAAGVVLFTAAGARATWAMLQVEAASLAHRSGETYRASRINTWLVLCCAVVIFLAPRMPRVHLSFLGADYGKGPLVGYVAALAVFILAYALSPALLTITSAVAEALTPPAIAARTPAFAIAARRSRRAGLRGQAQVATLAGGLSLIVTISIMTGGFRASLDRWFRAVFVAELVGEPTAALRETEQKPRISERDLESLRKLPSAEGVDCLLLGSFSHNGEVARVAGIEDEVLPGRPVPMEPLQLGPGLTPRDVFAIIERDPRQVLVSESFATRHRVHVGESLTLDLAGKGGERFNVLGIIREYSSESGYVLLHRNAYKAISGLEGCHNLRIYTRSGAGALAVTDELHRVDDSLASRLRIYPAEELRRNVLQTFDDTFSVTKILSILAAILGALALLTQLLQSTYERRVEWYALRRVGLSASGLFRLCSADLLISVFAGTLLGIGSGLVLAWLLCYAINKQAFGWSVDYGSADAWTQVAAISVGFGALLWFLASALAFLVLKPWRKELWSLERE